jgi:excisionase family DNA binding protein
MSNIVESPSVGSPAKLLDVQGVAQLLHCSTRHVYRLSDAGRMPTPVRLGALVRWPANVIEAWVKSGCPSRGN